MSNANETIQQHRKRILQAQAARQQAREEEIARQEAEFAAEMERIKAEEKAAREAEEERKAEEQRVAEEKRKAEEERITEERRMEEEKRREEERKVEEKRVAREKQRLEERRITEEKRRVEEAAAEAEDERVHSAAYAKLVEENRVEREKAAKELERRQKNPVAKAQLVTVVILPQPSGSKKKTFKSKSVISDKSGDEEKELPPAPQGEKRKRPIRMISKGGSPDDEFEPEQSGSNPPPPSNNPLQNRPACSRCVLIGKSSECCLQSSRRQAQACVICHQQRQRCSWSGENASRRSRGKWVKLDDDEVYEGPAARVGERRFEGPGIAEQLAAIVSQNKELIDIARRSLVLQERMLHLMVITERREEAREEVEKSEDEDEDEDGEGEIDEEEKERNDEEKKRKEIREGKKRAE
ncbi:hypothetical protein GGU11DRAFT_828156 [Lentinula aff. detonsa]|nr:hypothetical protein GGU11DRAFT_828156 [Lentinula aff. detonsa]